MKMRGTVAKRIRKQVLANNPGGKSTKRHAVAGGKVGTVVMVHYSIRQQYQDAKRNYMKGER